MCLNGVLLGVPEHDLYLRLYLVKLLLENDLSGDVSLRSLDILDNESFNRLLCLDVNDRLLADVFSQRHDWNLLVV